MDALKVFGQLDYVRDEDLALIPVLEKQPKHVIYAPLANAPLPPDVVLLFVNAGQTLILSEAVQQVEHQNAPAMGRPACAVVPQVVNTGRAALSLGCCGARAYLDVLDDNSVLAQFHEIRRRDVYAGLVPTIQDSLRPWNPRKKTQRCVIQWSYHLGLGADRWAAALYCQSIL